MVSSYQYKVLALISLFLMFASLSAAQKMKAYQLYNAKGKKTNFAKMIKKATTANVILFGEAHDVSICHWLELEVFHALLDEDLTLTLGLEMFEADEQEDLDDYLAGKIDAKMLHNQIDLWSNYPTDYAPLIDLAKERGIPVTATNAPADVPRQVFKDGFEILDDLPEKIRSVLPPLPIPYDPKLPSYEAMLSMSHGGMNSENFPKAQAIRDATMAHHIVRTGASGCTLHVNGSYHSDDYEGINWYLKKERPNWKVITISTVLQDEIDNLESEYLNKADFIICVPKRMTRTYKMSF